FMQCLRIAQATKTEVVDPAAVAHRFESVDYAVRPQHIFWSEAESLACATLQGDSCMKLDKIDTISLEPRQSGFCCANRRGFDIADGVGLEANLGRDNRIRTELV